MAHRAQEEDEPLAMEGHPVDACSILNQKDAQSGTAEVLLCRKQRRVIRHKLIPQDPDPCPFLLILFHDPPHIRPIEVEHRIPEPIEGPAGLIDEHYGGICAG
jgi:hypothetical protein